MTMRWLDRLPRVFSEVIRGELASSSKVTLDRNESFAADQNRSNTTLFSYQQRQENKAKLACLASEYQFRFCSQLLSIYFTLCLPRQWRQKCLLAPTNVTTGEQRWRPQTPIWGGSISWTTNESASARNIAVAFYPGVYRGIIYISAGKTVSKKIYRLVGEFYLDWIFSCINNGKIITWYEVVWHTQTTLLDKWKIKER